MESSLKHCDEDNVEEDEEEMELPSPSLRDDKDKASIHRAAWEGDVVALQALLSAPHSAEQLKALDCHGRTALHIAAMRGHTEVVEALLAAGMQTSTRSAGGWHALHEAIQGQHKGLVRTLALAERAQLKARAKEQRCALMDQLSRLPDFTMQLKWELCSSVPGLGLVLRRYAPHDTYTIWKQGSKLRVDGTLMGINDEGVMGGSVGGGLLPEWERGHFSLIYSCVGGSARACFVNHTKKEWMDLKALHKRMAPDQQASLMSKVDGMMMSVAASHGLVEAQVVKSKDFRFDPVKGWIGRPLVEELDGWKAKVYEASLSLVKVKRFKLPLALPSTATWDEYQEAALPSDMVLEVPTNPLTSAVYSQGQLETKEAVHNFQQAARKEAFRIRTANAEAVSASLFSPSGQRSSCQDASSQQGAGAGTVCKLEATTEPLAGEEQLQGPGLACVAVVDGAYGPGEGMLHCPGVAGAAGGEACATGDGGWARVRDAPCAPGAENHSASPHGQQSSSASSWRVPVGTTATTTTTAVRLHEAGRGSCIAPAHADLPTGQRSQHGPLDQVVVIPQMSVHDPSESVSVMTGDVSPGSDSTVRYREAGAPWCDSPHTVPSEPAPWQAQQQPPQPSVDQAQGKQALLQQHLQQQPVPHVKRQSAEEAQGQTKAVRHSAGVLKLEQVPDNQLLQPEHLSADSASGPGGVLSPKPVSRRCSLTLLGQRSSLGGAGPSALSAAAMPTTAPVAEEGKAGEDTGPRQPPVFKPAKRLTGRCWMAEDFPLSLHELLPLLEAIGAANKYVSKVAQFMSKYGDRKEFPVKVMVPLLFTLNMTLAFKKFKLLPTSAATAPINTSTSVPSKSTAAAGASSTAAGAVDTAAASKPAAEKPKKKFWSSFLGSSSSSNAPPVVVATGEPAMPAAAAAAGSVTAEPAGTHRRSRGLWGSGGSAHAAGGAGHVPNKGAAIPAALPADFFDIPEDYKQVEGENSLNGALF